MCSEKVIVTKIMRTIDWGKQCEWVLLVFVLVGAGRDIHW